MSASSKLKTLHLLKQRRQFVKVLKIILHGFLIMWLGIHFPFACVTLNWQTVKMYPVIGLFGAKLIKHCFAFLAVFSVSSHHQVAQLLLQLQATPLDRNGKGCMKRFLNTKTVVATKCVTLNGVTWRNTSSMTQSRTSYSCRAFSQAAHWKQILCRILDVTLFLGERGLVFIGKIHLIGDLRNGNFLGTFELISHYDSILEEHLNKVKESQIAHHRMQVHYLSPESQKYFIWCWAKNATVQPSRGMCSTECHST